jgi:rubrerythrin
MNSRDLNPKDLSKTEDWIGNNIAFACPVCGKVYIVSGRLNPKGRKCPVCGRSEGFVKGGAKDGGGKASIHWEM